MRIQKCYFDDKFEYVFIIANFLTGTFRKSDPGNNLIMGLESNLCCV